jgi:hypothetical protein
MEQNKVAVMGNNTLQTYDLNAVLPNLSNAKPLNADFTSEYWTPKDVGEEKRCFFQKIAPSTYTDEKTGEQIELPCIVVLAQDKDGNVKTIRNGSRRLVACIEEAVNNGSISTGTPICISYLGEEKNKTNAYKSSRWSVKPLIV